MKSINDYSNKFDDLFKKDILVSEKIDAPKISLTKHLDSFKISKVNSNHHVNRIDRTILSLYEPIFNHFDELKENLEGFELLPENHIFEMYFLPNTKPNVIQYDVLPNNNLILYGIKVMEGGKLKKVIKDPSVLERWSSLFNIDPIKYFYNGKIDDNQKFKLKELFNNNIISKDSLSRQILYTLDPRITETTLGKSTHNNIKGLFFTFHKGTEVTNAQLNTSDSVKVNETKPNDSFQLVILDLLEYFDTSVDWEKVRYYSKNENTNYIEVISEIFNDYVDKNAHKFIGFKLDKLSFSHDKSFKLNKKFISNQRTLKLLENPILEDLFQAMIGNFRKEKTKTSGLFNETNIERINIIVNKLNNQSKRFDMGKKQRTVDFTTFISEGRNHLYEANFDFKGVVKRIADAEDDIERMDPSSQDIIANKLTDTADYISNFGPIKTIKDFFVDLKGFSDGDWESIEKVIMKESQEGLSAIDSYIKNPQKVDYFLKLNKPTDIASQMKKDFGLPENFVKSLFAMAGKMKAGKGVGRGELFLGFMIDGATNASQGDVNVNGVPYEVKANEARLNTQNGFGQGTPSMITMFKNISKLVKGKSTKELDNLLDKKKIATYNFKKDGSSSFYKVFQEGIKSGAKLDDLINVVVESAYCSESGIWQNADKNLKKAVKKSFKDNLNSDGSGKDGDNLQFELLYHNIQYYNSCEPFMGIFLIDKKKHRIAYLDTKQKLKPAVKWLKANVKYTQNSWQDAPTSNCYKITLK